MRQARKMIDNQSSSARPADLKVMLFFGGASLMLVLISALFLFIPSYSGDTDYDEFIDALDVERVSFIITYVVFASGLVIQILQSYGINYLYIFELDPHYKMTHF